VQPITTVTCGVQRQIKKYCIIHTFNRQVAPVNPFSSFMRLADCLPESLPKSLPDSLPESLTNSLPALLIHLSPHLLPHF
jgi:hypothetical protein